MSDTPRAIIRTRRQEMGLTQAQAARQAGISQVYWSQVERGTRNPGGQNMFAMAEVLGLSVEVFRPVCAPKRDTA